jgi:hypothetical protein
MVINIPKVVRKFIKQLKLQWRVIVEPGKGDMLSMMSEFIDVDRKIGQHHIYTPPNYLAKPEYFRAAWAHELCHAFLGERLDLIFAGSPVIGEIDPKEYDRRVKILYLAGAHEDLFANDVRHSLLDCELAVEDVYSTHEHFLEIVKMAKAGHPQALRFLQDRRLPWILALNIAKDKRYNCEVGAEEVLELYELKLSFRQKIEAIYFIYRDLPQLSWQRQRDLRAFEESVQRVVTELFRETWKPRMINDRQFPARKVWSIE